MVSTLPDLPVELLNAIIHELPKIGPANAKVRNDLMNLRLACRTIQAKTRRRFLCEYGPGLKIDVPYRAVKEDNDYYHDIYSNPEFQEFIQVYKICLAQCDLSEDDVDAWTLFTEFIMDDCLKRAFGKILKNCPNLKMLQLCGPALPLGVSLELQEKINLAWQKAFKDTLTAASSDERLRLKAIMLGVSGSSALPIPTHWFQGIPKSSKFLCELQELLLVRVIDEDAHDLVQHSSAADTTNTLDEFIALAPKVKILEYIGALGGHLLSTNPGLDGLPRTLSPLSNLTKIRFKHLAISHSLLAAHLLKSKATLKSLALENVNLTSGTWIGVFGMIRAKLKLTWINLDGLKQDREQRLYFHRVLRHRPLVLDAEASLSRDSTKWTWAMWNASGNIEFDDAEIEAKGQEIGQMIDEGWIWVDRNTRSYCITLSLDEGDDVNDWLLQIERLSHLWPS